MGSCHALYCNFYVRNSKEISQMCNQKLDGQGRNNDPMPRAPERTGRFKIAVKHGIDSLSESCHSWIITRFVRRPFTQIMSCICYENKAMGIYFINDPDNYWIEIVPKR
jgi:hypothetical protein